MKKIILFLIILINSITIKAQGIDWNLNGYIKNLSTYFNDKQHYFPSDIGRFQNNVKLRLNLELYLTDDLQFSIQNRTIYSWQRNLKSYNQFMPLSPESSYYYNLKYNIHNSDNSNINSEIDRLNLNWSFDDFEVTIGRQRVMWGTCLVWNPTDLLNPFNFLDFDYVERPGNDAIMMQYYTGPVSEIDILIKPGKTENDIIYSGRYLTNFKEYDLALIAAWQKKAYKFGVNWSGSLLDGGFRGEVLFSSPQNYEYMILNFDFRSSAVFIQKKLDKNFTTIALSYDYTFANSAYLHLEYMYNELGATKNTALRLSETIHTGELSPARHSTYLGIGYDLTPLMRGELFSLYNPLDPSYMIGPSIKYSIAENWELYTSAFFPQGDILSEFGAYPDQYFLRTMYSF
jgi:hypothetical protein